MMAVLCLYKAREENQIREWEDKEHHQSLNATLVLLCEAGTNNESKKEEIEHKGARSAHFCS